MSQRNTAPSTKRVESSTPSETAIRWPTTDLLLSTTAGLCALFCLWWRRCGAMSSRSNAEHWAQEGMASSRHAGHAGPGLSGRCASARHQGERTSTSRQTCCPSRFPRCAGSSGVSSGQGRPIPVASSLGRTGDADTSSAPDDHTGPAEPELINPGCSTNDPGGTPASQ